MEGRRERLRSSNVSNCARCKPRRPTRGSVPYRARETARGAARASLIMKFLRKNEESFKSAKVRRERDKRATRAGWLTGRTRDLRGS